MSHRKLTDDQLNTFLAAGGSQAEAARHFGVSEAAIYQRLKRQNGRTARVMALEHAGTVVDQQLDGAARLAKIQGVVDQQLDWALAEARRPGADRASLTDVVLRLVAEVRAQLGLQLQITKSLIDLKLVRAFQETVVAEIRAEAPATAQRIVDRLKERRSLRSSVDLPGLTGSSDHAALG
jgi:hypothetical protein